MLSLGNPTWEGDVTSMPMVLSRMSITTISRPYTLLLDTKANTLLENLSIYGGMKQL